MPELAAKRLVFIFTHRGGGTRSRTGYWGAVGAHTGQHLAHCLGAGSCSRVEPPRGRRLHTNRRQRAHCLGAGSCLRVEPVRAMVRGVAVVRDEMVRAMTGSGLKLGPAAGFTSSLLEAWRG